MVNCTIQKLVKTYGISVFYEISLLIFKNKKMEKKGSISQGGYVWFYSDASGGFFLLIIAATA